jgi:hypothetical protein
VSERGDEYAMPTLEEALKAWDRYNNSSSLEVGDGLWVYGSVKALTRVQLYLLAQTTKPDERKDIKNYLDYELKRSEDTVKLLRQEIAELRNAQAV